MFIREYINRLYINIIYINMYSGVHTYVHQICEYCILCWNSRKKMSRSEINSAVISAAAAHPCIRQIIRSRVGGTHLGVSVTVGTRCIPYAW